MDSALLKLARTGTKVPRVGRGEDACPRPCESGDTDVAFTHTGPLSDPVAPPFFLGRRGNSDSYLVDPASSHMLVSKIKPCMSKYKQLCTVKLRMAH